MENQATSTKLPKLFWIVGWGALLWNLMGVMAYLTQVFMPAEMFQQLTIEQQQLIENTPAWATAAFAVAVWGGTIGAILLLMKKKSAKIAFIFSLVGVSVQIIHSLFFSNSMEVYGPGGLIMPFMIVLFGIGLIWFSEKAAKNGWVS